jgi:hypothetical protein
VLRVRSAAALVSVVVTVLGLGLAASPALAADGEGTAVVSPTYVVAGSTGNDLTFTYTVGASGMTNGNLTLNIPAGWTPPGNGFSNGGIGGTCTGDANNGATENGQLVTISGLTLSAGSTCTIQYGIHNFNGGDTAPTTTGNDTFTIQEQSNGSSGGLINLTAGSPVVKVGDDGTGTMQVAPTHVIAGTTGTTLTFTYQAFAQMTSGELTLAVPSGWSTPSTTASAAGATTSTCGTVGVFGSTIQVTGVTLAANATCTVTYGNKASGPGATADPNGGPAGDTFTTQQEAATSDNNLVALASSPNVSVTAGDGVGTNTVTPTHVIQSSTGNYLTFTYTVPAGGMSHGTLTLLVPNGWTPPSNGFNNGGIGGTCSADSGNGAQESGQLVTISDLSLNGGTSCTIQYGISGFNGGDTAPSTEGAYTFTTQEASTATGTLTNIAVQPVVNVGSDGTGTLAVAPTHFVAGSSGNTLTFTYTAGVDISGGELTVAVPAGWSAPSTTASAAGATTSTCGTVGILNSTIQVTGITLSNGSTCTVTYGDKSSGPGVVAPSSGGPTPVAFAAQEKSSSGGTLTTLGNGSPSVIVTALDGTGTNVVSPTTVITSSTGNDLTFTYTAAAGGMSNGTLTLLIPNGWTPPANGFSAGGIGGTCSADSNNGAQESGQLVTISGLSLNDGATCTIQYGIKNFNSGVTAPSTNGQYTFTTQQASTATGTLTSIASQPVVTVGNDGTGTMQVAPTSAVANSSGNTFVFTYQAATTVSNGELTVAVPGGWSAPSTTASAAGATTSTCGTVGVLGTTIQVTGVSLATNATCTITYGNKASGPGATAPATGGGGAPYTFTTQQKSTSGGTLTTLGNGSPQVIVTAPDGGGTMTVSPTTAINNSTGNDFDFTYTAPAGGLNNGQLSLLVPTGWTTPSATTSSAGGVSVPCTNNAIQISSVGGGSLITITGITLDGGQTCDIRYGLQNFNSGVTAPSGSGDYVFTAQEASTSAGTLTNLGSSPDVEVSSDGSGTLGVSPLTLSAGATGKTLTFTYTAGVSLSNGEVAVAIPSGWSAPSTTGTDAGFTSTDCSGGSVHVTGTTIHVTGITIGAGTSCSINYGAKTSGGAGATVTSTVGAAQFHAQERSTNTGSLTDLASSPSVTVYAADGSGTLAVAPTFLTPGSAGNTLTFTYTAASGGLNSGQLTIPMPADWSSPSTTPQVAGYTSSTCGSVSINNLTIKVTGINLGGGGQCTVTYGNKSSGGTGATVSSTSGTVAFTAQEVSTISGTAGDLASEPQLDIVAADGSGTLAVAPNKAIAGSTGNTLTFSYTAAGGGTNGGEVDIAVPAGWSAPSTTANAPGAATSTCGTVAVTGSTIQLTGVTLAGSATCTITYGSRAGSGPGATAPAASTTSTFSGQQKSTAAGTLTALAASPSVTVTLARKLTVTVKGKGHVSGNGISCPGTCSKSYPSGTFVSLTAKPASGFRFSGWSGACTGKALCHFTINSNAAVTATFTAIPVCVVPNVKGDTLTTAEQKIRAAHCAVGKVTKPANSAGHPLVVGSTTPGPGTRHPAGTKVNITMVRKRR